jgi:hypothetical protein
MGGIIVICLIAGNIILVEQPALSPLPFTLRGCVIIINPWVCVLGVGWVDVGEIGEL